MLHEDRVFEFVERVVSLSKTAVSAILPRESGTAKRVTPSKKAAGSSPQPPKSASKDPFSRLDVGSASTSSSSSSNSNAGTVSPRHMEEWCRALFDCVQYHRLSAKTLVRAATCELIPSDIRLQRILPACAAALSVDSPAEHREHSGLALVWQHQTVNASVEFLSLSLSLNTSSFSCLSLSCLLYVFSFFFFVSID